MVAATLMAMFTVVRHTRAGRGGPAAPSWSARPTSAGTPRCVAAVSSPRWPASRPRSGDRGRGDGDRTAGAAGPSCSAPRWAQAGWCSPASPRWPSSSTGPPGPPTGWSAPCSASRSCCARSATSTAAGSPGSRPWAGPRPCTPSPTTAGCPCCSAWARPSRSSPGPWNCSTTATSAPACGRPGRELRRRAAGSLTLGARRAAPARRTLAWAVSLALLGAVYGGLGDAVETLFADNPAAQEFFPDATSAGLVEAYLATIFSIDALLAAAFAVSSVLRAHTEEASGRAEPILATATSRASWLGSHVTVALFGSGLLVVAVSEERRRWSGPVDRRLRDLRPAVRRVARLRARRLGARRRRRGRRRAPAAAGPGAGLGCGGLRRGDRDRRPVPGLAGLGERPLAVRLDAAGADRGVDDGGGGGPRRRRPGAARRRLRRRSGAATSPPADGAQPFFVGGSPRASASWAVAGS